MEAWAYIFVAFPYWFGIVASILLLFPTFYLNELSSFDFPGSNL